MTVLPHTILLDAHALSSLADEARSLREWVAWAIRTGSPIHISALTLAETTDGTSRDARIRRAAKALVIEPVTPAIGYSAGALRAKAAKERRKPRDLTVDAVITATALALRPPVVVLTSDKPDLDLLLADSGVIVENLN